MSMNFDAIAFAIALTVNLFLFGFSAFAALKVILRLAEKTSPRVRYIIAVVAFSTAAVAPFVSTIPSVFKSFPSSANVALPARNLNVDFQKENFEMEKSSAETFPPTEMTKELSAAFDAFVSNVAQTKIAKGFVILWLCLSVLLLWRELEGHLKISRMRKDLRPAGDLLRKELSCSNNRTFYVSESESPVTIGLFQPAVILPARFPAGVSQAAMRGILRHEMSHARWRDPLVNALLKIVRAIFWISPALWLIERVVRDEQESAADFDALKISENSSKINCPASDYATSLLIIAKYYNELSAKKNFGAATHFGGESRLESRVRRLFAESSKPPSIARRFLTVATVLLSFIGMSFLPVASQQATLAENKSNDNFPFAVRNSFSDVEARATEAQDTIVETKTLAIDAETSKNGRVYNLGEYNLVSVNTEMQSSVKRIENVKKEKDDETDLAVPAIKAVEPLATIKSLILTNEEKPAISALPQKPVNVIKPQIPIPVSKSEQ